MAKFKLKRWDTEAQENGKWMEYDDGEFLIAAVPNVKFTKGFVELSEKYEGEEKAEGFAVELNELLATTVLLGWKDVVGEDDKDIDYTPELGVQLLEADAPFGAWLLEQSRKQENFKRETKEKRSKK